MPASKGKYPDDNNLNDKRITPYADLGQTYILIVTTDSSKMGLS